ncbi:TPA: hypothetical protein H1005_01090 [archaeon]|uniref:Uncharacterized protein n=1 Tax=Candidatus Naiadarchaeum limnaeum TaxID=2756139 RepID=A0A832UUS1_9ARCH|nr:hypothetical protein [Candidatus Naiadarchaeales archaeon SRR2090153.bin1042]HIK00070.1 hypothetical protein [Candidatus Naiadarchaeum limnaeum]
MVLREVDEANSAALEKAVRNLLSSSRGKKPEEIFNNLDALADYVADAYFVVRSLEPNDQLRFLEICEILATKFSKRDIATVVKTQVSAQLIEA